MGTAIFEGKFYMDLSNIKTVVGRRQAILLHASKKLIIENTVKKSDLRLCALCK